MLVKAMLYSRGGLYCTVVTLGPVMADEHKRRLVDRTDRVDKSMFRVGLDWLKHLLNHDLPLDISFYLPPFLLDLSVR